MSFPNLKEIPWGTQPICGGGLAASAIGLNVLPRQAGGPQSAVKPVAGQSPMSDGFLRVEMLRERL